MPPKKKRAAPKKKPPKSMVLNMESKRPLNGDKETTKVDAPEVIETKKDTSENLQNIKENIKKFIQYFILGSLIALFTKQFLIDDNEITAYLIDRLRAERRLLARDQQHIQNSLNELNDLNISPAEIPNLVFATQADAEILPQQGTSEALTPDEEDFFDSVMHIRSSGYPVAIQRVMIEMLINSLNLPITIIENI